MIRFTADDAMEVAIKLEENGQNFYNRMAEKFDDPEVKKLFTFLKEEEIKHRETYTAMLSKLGKNQTMENYPEEYNAYLKAYAEKIIFSPQKLEEEISRINDEKTALNFAIGAELETILYYEEIKKMVSEKEKKLIEKVIEEERKHFIQLTNLERSIC